MIRARFLLFIPWLAAAAPAARAAVEASAPRQLAVQVYDTGLAVVNELRSVVLPAGESSVLVRQLPARLDPASVSVTPAAGGAGLDVLEQRFEYDLLDPARLLRRYLNSTIVVGSGATAREGRLAAAPVWREAPYPADPLILAAPDGSLLSYFHPAEAGRVTFPGAAKVVFDQPTLVWQARGAAEGQQNFRLGYLVRGLTWDVSYDVVLAAEGASARVSGRVGIRNESGGRFVEASLSLMETERGLLAGEPAGGNDAPAQRYPYGSSRPRDERTIANLAASQTYTLPRKVTIEDGESVYLPIVSAAQAPVRRIFVYDGVRFDRFQRNRRNDWNYGTEYHTTVDALLEFENTTAAGLGQDLPQGRLRLYQQGKEGAVDLLGSDILMAVAGGARGQARVGPARGLRGERERTGYTEVRPLHEYEESFEIRLSNDSGQAAEIRVVEHLYRWSEFEIVKSDAEYEVTGPQTIEFRPELKPGGKRAIHYTVRYRW